MRHSKFTAGAVLFSALCLSSCGNTDVVNIEALPFKADSDDRWGLIDWDGNIIIEDEFKDRPSCVKEGRFYVKNSDGEYEFYIADKELQQIGETYVDAAHFNEGLAPTVKKNEHIKYINTDGKTVFELTTTNDGKEITQAYEFSEGRALFYTEDNKYGFINTKGEIVIPAKYNFAQSFVDGYAIVATVESDDKKGEVIKTFLIDKDGKVRLTVSDKMQIMGIPQNGKIPFYYNKDEEKGERAIGFIDFDGNVVMEPNKKFITAQPFFFGYSTVANSDYEFGLIDEDGKIVIRPKYQSIYQLDSDCFLYRDDNEWGIMNYDGEIILRPDYPEVITFQGMNHIFAYDGDSWSIIDKKGEEISKDSYDVIEVGIDKTYVESDFVDMAAEVKKAMSIISDKGFDKATFSITPERMAQLYGQSADELSYTYNISSDISLGRNLNATILAEYPVSITEPVYEEVVEQGYYGNYTTNRLAGYRFRDMTNQYLSLSLSPTNKLAYKSQEFFDELNKALVKAGYKEISESESGIDPYTTTDGMKFYKKGQIRLSVHLEYENIILRAYAQ